MVTLIKDGLVLGDLARFFSYILTFKFLSFGVKCTIKDSE